MCRYNYYFSQVTSCDKSPLWNTFIKWLWTTRWGSKNSTFHLSHCLLVLQLLECASRLLKKLSTAVERHDSGLTTKTSDSDSSSSSSSLSSSLDIISGTRTFVHFSLSTVGSEDRCKITVLLQFLCTYIRIKRKVNSNEWSVQLDVGKYKFYEGFNFCRYSHIMSCTCTFQKHIHKVRCTLISGHVIAKKLSGGLYLVKIVIPWWAQCHNISPTLIPPGSWVHGWALFRFSSIKKKLWC